MTLMNVTLFLLFFISLAINVSLVIVVIKSLRRIQEHIEQFETFEGAVKKALEAVSIADADLSRAATAEVVYDDPTVRKVVASMKASHEAIGEIWKFLSSLIDEGQEDLPDDNNLEAN